MKEDIREHLSLLIVAREGVRVANSPFIKPLWVAVGKALLEPSPPRKWVDRFMAMVAANAYLEAALLISDWSLPGWHWSLNSINEFWIGTSHPITGQEKYEAKHADHPALAILLAVLQAKIVEANRDLSAATEKARIDGQASAQETVH